MTNENEIFVKLRNACVDVDTSNMSVNSSFRKSGLDSMDIAMLMLDIEETYGIKIPSSDISSLDSVATIVDYVNKKVS
jgi:acyl carrier protein